MNAKLGNFSEISKLLSVKSKMSGDILSLKFPTPILWALSA